MTEELDLSGVPAPTSNNNEYAPIIDLGVDVFKIKDIEMGASMKKKTPYMRVTFTNRDEIPFKEDFYLTSKALVRVKELLINCGVEDDVSNASRLSIDTIKEKLLGKQIRLIIGGEEFMNNEGKTRIRRTLPYKYFSESIEISKEKSRLKYDPNWHYKGLKQNTDQGAVIPKPTGDDLSF